MSADILTRSIHRRNFLRTGAVAAAGALFAGSGGTLIAADAAERTARRFIGKYSDQFLCISANAVVTRFVAHMGDLPRFCEAMFRAKAEGISNLRVAGKVATFRAGGRVFEVENLMREDFAVFKSGNSAAVNS
ncbi:MAG: twin-arginine translocation signal domain-containing protein [Chthoniobacteraceae bacterium]